MKEQRIPNYSVIEEYVHLFQGVLTNHYDLSKPVVATLEYIAWGKSANLLLYFSTPKVNFRTSVFHNLGYKTRDKSLCFRDLNLIGKQIELTISKTKNDYLNIKSAKVLED